MKAKIKLFAVCLLALTAAATDRYSDSQPHMGTVVSITLYADTPQQAQQAFTAAFHRIAQLDRILSDYDPQSELSRICSLTSPLSEDLRTVVETAQRLSAETNGAFDVTVGPLSRLWRTARREKRLPSDLEIQEAVQRSGYRKLMIHEGRASCTVPAMQLDAGGIGKGYAGDEALAALRSQGITRALIAVSGDIVAGDAPPGKSGWRVKIPGEILELENRAVSTSGDEFQYLEIDGVRYSHIFDPRTGKALRNSRTVTVIAEKGIDADSITKAIAIDGPEMVQRLQEKYGVRIMVY